MNRMMKRLAAIRKRRRLSYRDIEKQTGIPAARMEELEKGAAAITVDELAKLLALYLVPIDREMRTGRRRLLAVPAAMLAAAVLLAGAAGQRQPHPERRHERSVDAVHG